MTRPKGWFLFFKKWTKSRQKRSSNTSKSINDKFLDCEFIVNPKFHLRTVAGKDQASRYVDCRQHWPRMHAGDVPPPHHHDERVGGARMVAPERRLRTQKAQELSDYTARFQQVPGYSSVQVQRVPTNTPCGPNDAVLASTRCGVVSAASADCVSSGFQFFTDKKACMFSRICHLFMSLRPKTYAERSASIFCPRIECGTRLPMTMFRLVYLRPSIPEGISTRLHVRNHFFSSPHVVDGFATVWISDQSK